MDKLDCIDNLDKRILQIVMHNARIPSKDVALVCGVSRAAIHQRIQRMIELGIITGSGYNVNTQLLGYSTCTYIGVNLERAALYSTVVQEFEKIPEIRMPFHNRPLHHAHQTVCQRQPALDGAAKQKDTDDTRRCRHRDTHFARPFYKTPYPALSRRIRA